jgi:hypothetical protein
MEKGILIRNALMAGPPNVPTREAAMHHTALSFILGTVALAANLGIPAGMPEAVAAEPLQSLTAEGQIIRIDPRFDRLVPSEAKLEKIA